MLAPAASAAPGYVITKLALEGESAPGTGGDAYGAFFDVHLNESGGVAFGVPLASGFPNGGVFVDAGAGPVLRIRNGDAPPAPIPGSYLAFGSVVRLDGSDRVAASAVVNTGGGSLSGLFLDTAGSDSSLAVAGDPAPSPPGDSLDVGLADTSFFGLNAAGDLAFRSAVTGGSASSGIFVRSAGGVVSLVSQQGDLVGAGPDAFASFEHPALNDAGQVVFGATLGGGSASAGLFLDSGSGPVALALDGDAAPDSGGAAFVDFLVPSLNTSGQVAFLSNLAGGAATGGAFTASPGLAAVVVENQAVPGAGPVSTVASLPDIASDGRVALSLGFASGPLNAGVYQVLGGAFDAVVVDGETAPDAGGALFESFGWLSSNDAGQVAFVATLDDGRTGAFLATPTVPQVPALPLGGGIVVAALLIGAARHRFTRG
jgi:hypothetical protein